MPGWSGLGEGSLLWLAGTAALLSSHGDSVGALARWGGGEEISLSPLTRPPILSD